MLTPDSESRRDWRDSGLKLAAVMLPRREPPQVEFWRLQLLCALFSGNSAEAGGAEEGGWMLMGGGACGAKFPKLLLLLPLPLPDEVETTGTGRALGFKI